MADLSPKFDYTALQQSVLQSPDPIQTPASIATPQKDDIYYDDLKNRTRFLVYRAVGSATSCYVANTVGGELYVPFSGNVPQFWAYVDTPGTTGSMSIALRFNNGSGFGTLATMTIASGAAGSAIFTATNSIGQPFTRQNVFHVNVTGVHTTPALGLTFVLAFVDTSRGVTGSKAAI